MKNDVRGNDPKRKITITDPIHCCGKHSTIRKTQKLENDRREKKLVSTKEMMRKYGNKNSESDSD